MLRQALTAAKAVFCTGMHLDRMLTDEKNKRCAAASGRLPPQNPGVAASVQTEKGGVMLGSTCSFTEAGLTASAAAAVSAALLYLLCTSAPQKKNARQASPHSKRKDGSK